MRKCVGRVFKKISLKPNAASHNNASWYTDTDGFQENSPSKGSLKPVLQGIQKIILDFWGKGRVPPHITFICSRKTKIHLTSFTAIFIVVVCLTEEYLWGALYYAVIKKPRRKLICRHYHGKICMRYDLVKKKKQATKQCTVFHLCVKHF